MLTIFPPPRARITGTTARQVRNIEATLTSITRRHSSSGICSNGRISSDAYRPGVVDEDVDRPAPLDHLVGQPLHVVLVRDVDGEADALGNAAAASSAPCRSATTMRAPRGQSFGERPADALRAPVTTATLPSSAHQRIGENDVGIRMRLCWVWSSGWSRPRKSFHASSACRLRPTVARARRSSS